MSLDQNFAEYFKPEIQKRGREDFLKGTVFVTNVSDTSVNGLVKGMPPHRVNFIADSISSPSFEAQCSCSTGTKGGFCKHMWSLILGVEKKHPDFLSSKTTIEVNELGSVSRKQSSNKTLFLKTKPKATPEAEVRAAEYKEKQSALKRQQYEKQKAWAKENRLEKKTKKNRMIQAERAPYPSEVEESLVFFTQNGFSMESLPSAAVLQLAKKHLSRVFHPDKGGSHEEAIVLNQHFEILNRYIAGAKK